MSSATHLGFNREAGSNLCGTLVHAPQPEMTRNTRFNNSGTNAPPFIIDYQAKVAGGIMNSDANGALSMLQCISQGFSSNLNDLFPNTSSHRQFLTMGAVLDSYLSPFRKRRCRKSKRLKYVLLRKHRRTESSE